MPITSAPVNAWFRFGTKVKFPESAVTSWPLEPRRVSPVMSPAAENVISPAAHSAGPAGCPSRKWG